VGGIGLSACRVSSSPAACIFTPTLPGPHGTGDQTPGLCSAQGQNARHGSIKMLLESVRPPVHPRYLAGGIIRLGPAIPAHSKYSFVCRSNHRTEPPLIIRTRTGPSGVSPVSGTVRGAARRTFMVLSLARLGPDATRRSPRATVHCVSLSIIRLQPVMISLFFHLSPRRSRRA